MQYPDCLLPTPYHKSIDCDITGCFLIRLVDPIEGIPFLTPENNEININYICSPKERIEDLSTSLVGEYNLEHINIKLTQKGKFNFGSYWDGNESVAKPQYIEDFTNDGNRTFWCAPVSKLNGEKFNFTSDNSPMVATCLVIHTPAKWNFWHFSLRWKTDQGKIEDLDEKLRKKIAKRIGHSVRASISHFAIVRFPEHTKIERRCYMKN